MAIAADVVDHLEVLLRVHVGHSAFLKLLHLANYLLDQRVFQHDSSEALMVHSLEDRVLIGTLQAQHIQ